jgi:anti-sigma28 factor (negative regulator of flagellin synthesis)
MSAIETITTIRKRINAGTYDLSTEQVRKLLFYSIKGERNAEFK